MLIEILHVNISLHVIISDFFNKSIGISPDWKLCRMEYIDVMNKSKMTKLDPVLLGYTLNPDLPLLSYSMDVDSAGCAAPHKHPRGQFVYASSGVMRVICGNASWLVPPSQGVWLPPETEHEVYFPGKVQIRNIFFDPSFMEGLPLDSCVVLKVSPLLRELILKAVSFGDSYERKSPAWRLMAVLRDELSVAEHAGLCLPMPVDERALRVSSVLLKNPADSRTLEDWARLACTSSRTLLRIFEKETSLSFGDWRRNLRFMKALERLDAGESVNEVALSSGYESSTAFISAFRKLFGESPMRYLAACSES